MNRGILLSIFFICFLSLISSCEKAPFLVLNTPNSINFPEQGGTQTVSFSVNRAWTVSSSESWCKVSPSFGSDELEGNTFTITCEPNTSYDKRACVITLQADELIEIINIIQDQNNGLFITTPDYNLSYDSHILSISVQSNVPFTVDVEAESQSWISVLSTKSLSDSEVSLNVSQNDGYERTGHVTIRYDDLLEVVTIKQKSGVVVFEDARFKAYCVDNFDEDGDGEISFSEADRVATINVNTEGILSLGGVEYFSNLESLICSPEFDGSIWSSSDRVWHLHDNEGNEVVGGLAAVDLSKNVLLKQLCVSGNQLTSLDISNNSTLQYLDCSYNLLSSLDVLSNTELTYLNCNFNNISKLDVSLLSSLIELICSHNRLGFIDVSQNTLLKYFECDTNYLTSLDLSNNTLLVDLNCSYNQLSIIDVSMHPSLWRLRCVYNKLPSLDVSHNPSLKYLRCEYNQISLLDISLNPALSGLNCTGNNLTSIDVSNNPLLSDFQCKNNPITVIWLKRGQTISLFVYDKDYVTIKYIGPEVVPEAVDLGLPSGLKWASFNLGASTPEEYGDQYAWGEIEPYYSGQGPYTWRAGKEIGYSWESYKWCMGSWDTLTKYCYDSTYGYNDFTDTKTVLDPDDDAAHVNLGGNWRMPTGAEWRELINNCTWILTAQNGVSGLLVTAANGNSIFLPAASYRIAGYLYPAGSTASYWSSSLGTYGPYYACYMYFYPNNAFTRNTNRYSGLSIRPVYESNRIL